MKLFISLCTYLGRCDVCSQCYNRELFSYIRYWHLWRHWLLRLLSASQKQTSCVVLHSSGADDTRGFLAVDTGSLRSPTRAALSRSVAIDQNPTEGEQRLEEERLGLRSCPDRQSTLGAVEEELPIVVPCSTLMAISRRLRSNLTQLMVRSLSSEPCNVI